MVKVTGIFSTSVPVSLLATSTFAAGAFELLEAVAVIGTVVVVELPNTLLEGAVVVVVVVAAVVVTVVFEGIGIDGVINAIII